MREIKFRAKRYTDGLGHWVYGVIAPRDAVLPHNTFHLSKFFELLEEGVLDPKTLGQYTGLKDKNGVGIYEGDVLSSHEPRWPAAGHQDCSGVVAWRDEYAHYGCGRWKLDTGNINYLQLEVIGNIHENPELLN